VVPDGTVRDEYRLARGWWEAKETADDLAAEIGKKLKAGYHSRNAIFEDTEVAVLYQNRGEAGEFALDNPLKIATLLTRFLAHDETDEAEHWPWWQITLGNGCAADLPAALFRRRRPGPRT
jgi:hypothetical protein